MVEKSFIFKDELCDAKWSMTKVKCLKGSLKFTGNNVTDFDLYRTWCKGCNKIKVIDRNHFAEQFKGFVKAVDRELAKL